MDYDQLIVKQDGSGAMALFHGEVVGVVLNGSRVDTDHRLPARKIAETASLPRTRVVVSASDEPRYTPFVEAP
ncbi:hypothetical protein HYV64_04035 [Candidatus Shapirobacteria bacterium]|nr:hypothetical protein [Candidatus Shapirobacteria bacterium]